MYGGYMRHDTDTMGDIDIAISFAVKTEANSNRKIQHYMEREGVD